MKLAVVAFGLVALAACGGEKNAPASAAPALAASSVGAPSPVGAVPRTWAKTAAGCGDVFLDVADATKTHYLVVRTRRNVLGLNAQGDSATVDLATQPESGRRIDVSVDVWNGPNGSEEYCTDVRSGNPRKLAVWNPVKGKVTLTLTAFRGVYDFDVTLKLEGVVLRRADGALEPIPDTTFPVSKVGWLPG